MKDFFARLYITCGVFTFGVSLGRYPDFWLDMPNGFAIIFSFLLEILLWPIVLGMMVGKAYFFHH